MELIQHEVWRPILERPGMYTEVDIVCIYHAKTKGQAGNSIIDGCIVDSLLRIRIQSRLLSSVVCAIDCCMIERYESYETW